MFLLDRPMDKLPTIYRRRQLAGQRFGMPMDDSASIFNRFWDVDEVWDHIISSFPDAHLALVGFLLKKASKSTMLSRLDFTSVDQLKKDVGKGKLFVVPKRQITQPPLSESSADEDELPDLGVLNPPQRERNPSAMSNDLATTVETDVIMARPDTESNDIAAAGPDRTPTTPLTSPTHGQESRVQRIAATAARETIRENALIIMSSDSMVTTDLLSIPSRTRTRDRLSRRARHVETLSEIAVDTSHVDAGTPTVQFRRVTGQNTIATITSTATPVDTVATATETPVDTVATPTATPVNTVAIPTATPNTVATPTATSVDRVTPPTTTLVDTVATPMPGTSSSVTQNTERLEMDLSAALLDLEKFISAEQRTLMVTRADIVTDMINSYQDSSLLDCRLHVEFLGEPGDDFGGLTKEVFTIFWREATKSLFIGEHCVVPYLPLHLQRRDSWKFVSLGRILTHTIMLTGSMPPNLSRSFLIDLIFDCEVGEDCLLEDFMLYVTEREKNLVMKAISSHNALTRREVERLTNLYTAYRFLDIPREAEIKNQILAIAAQELLQKPSPLCKLIRKGIPACHLEGFWTQLSIDHITYMLQKQRPTADKVVECLVPAEEHLLK